MSTEGIINDLLEQVRAMRTAEGRRGQFPVSAPNVINPPVGWDLDIDVQRFVFVSGTGTLRVDVAAGLVVSAGSEIAYGYLLRGPASSQEEAWNANDAVGYWLGRSVSVLGGSLRAGRPFWHTGLASGWYRLFGATYKSGGTGSISDRLIIATVP